LGFVARSGRRRAPLLAVLLAALLAAPATARADEKPAFLTGPDLQGNAVVGSTLEFVATWKGTPDPIASYRWGRCPPDAKDGTLCDVITGATGSKYVVTAADVGYKLAAEVTLTNKEGAVAKTTPPSAVVVAPPTPQPTPTPTPTPTPSTTPPPPSAPTIVASAPSLTSPRPTLLTPFPVVRIRGYFAPAGVRVALLAVRAPRGARISARCIGRGCPVRALPSETGPVRLRAFERFLRAGTLLQIRVVARGKIGKYTSFLIRAHKAPLRTDRCLMPNRTRPVACPRA
jgi:hypothetical protein